MVKHLFNMSDDKKSTITDVAVDAGVSKSLVSFYLNNKFDKMSSQTQERIAASIEKLQFSPNERYRRVKYKPTGMIGFIIPDLSDLYYPEVFKGVSDECMRHDLNVLIADTDNNVLKENQFISSLITKTDGIIICSVGNNDENIIKLCCNKPTVLLDRKTRVQKFDTVRSNNTQTMNELMEYLKTVGYEAFALFTPEILFGMSREERAEAFSCFATENELLYRIYTIDRFDQKKTLLGLVNFMEISKRKKAVAIAVNGQTLIDLLSCVNALNLKVPSDIGVCGYDDFSWAPLVNSGVTTINQPTYDIGVKCVSRLISRMKDNSLPPEVICLSAKLIIRGSV